MPSIVVRVHGGKPINSALVILKQAQGDEAFMAALRHQIFGRITGTGWRETSVAANPSMACGC
jgi:hypothetical protein